MFKLSVSPFPYQQNALLCPELTQTHVHRVSDAIQPSHALSSLLLLPRIPPSIRVFSSESILRMKWPKYWNFSFSISPSNDIQDWSLLEWTGWISLHSKGLSGVFSNTTVQKHPFFGAQLSSQSVVYYEHNFYLQPKLLWLNLLQLSHKFAAAVWNWTHSISEVFLYL